MANIISRYITQTLLYAKDGQVVIIRYPFIKFDCQNDKQISRKKRKTD